jgi:shikimate dehydrogenase
VIRGAVLGSPISHSLSPTLHSSAYKFLGIEGEYSAQEVPGGSLNSFISSQGDNFDYLSLTMPLKEEVLSLDVECDELTRRIQSGNTLIRVKDAWKLTSTDGSGFVNALWHSGITKISSALILGAWLSQSSHRLSSNLYL